MMNIELGEQPINYFRQMEGDEGVKRIFENIKRQGIMSFIALAVALAALAVQIVLE